MVFLRFSAYLERGKCNFSLFQNKQNHVQLSTTLITDFTFYLLPARGRQGHPETEKGLFFFHLSGCEYINK